MAYVVLLPSPPQCPRIVQKFECICCFAVAMVVMMTKMLGGAGVWDDTELLSCFPDVFDDAKLTNVKLSCLRDAKSLLGLAMVPNFKLMTSRLPRFMETRREDMDVRCFVFLNEATKIENCNIEYIVGVGSSPTEKALMWLVKKLVPSSDEDIKIIRCQVD